MRHQAATRFLRVPAADWPLVRQGIKTEFRTRPEDRVALTQCYLPTPVVAYTTAAGVDSLVSKLMVLEDRRREPIFNIADDDEGLAREGFESYDHFRRYWRKRCKGRYVPLERVWVWRVREFVAADLASEGERMIRELYSEHLHV